MKVRWRSEVDEWTLEGHKITAPENLALIHTTLEQQGPIIVEHWFYRGGRAPERRIFEDFDEFMAYRNEDTYAGDAVDVWSFAEVCQPDKRLAEGKCPDDDGLVPRRGAY